MMPGIRCVREAWVLRLVYRYMLAVGLIANLALAALLVYWLVGKVANSEVYRDLNRTIHGSLDGVPPIPVPAAAPGTINPALKALPAGVWHKIHQQAGDSPGDFRRQAHGSAAFDPVRGRLMLFGSDTHQLDWDNSVRFFDMGSLSWSRSYPPDDYATYRVNADGVPVAGRKGDRPWAMHTFDAVEFDPISDRLIVASHPAHLSPEKRWGVDPALWRQIAHHPTWAYHVGDNRWQPLVKDGESFFPYAVTFDPHRRWLVGVKPGGYWALSVDNAEWTLLAKGSPRVWHNSAAFDSDLDTLVSFGAHNGSNAVWQYRLGQEQGRVMPTPGARPPGGGSIPLVYHPRVKKVVALVDADDGSQYGEAQTWLYSVADDAWEPIPGARLPFKIGINYDMVYDPNHELLILVANLSTEPTAVWVLRL